MLVGDLLTKVRRRLRDEDPDPDNQLWTDVEIIDDYANEVRNRMIRKVRRLIMDSSTTTSSTGVYLCSIPIVAGTAKYAFNKYIVEIQRAQLISLSYPLVEKDVVWMDNNIPNWKYSTTTGTPDVYITDLDTGYITLNPIPRSNDTLNLTCSRRPLTDLTATTLNADLGFLEEFHEDIIPGILQLCFEKKDSQTDRPEQAAYYQKKFEDKLKELELECYRRMHVSNTIGVRYSNMAK